MDSLIIFHYTGPSNEIVAWYFGDGANSTDTAPGHVYTTTGAFKVSLLVRVDSTHPVDTMSKTIDIAEPSIYHYAHLYTHLMGGTRTWHGYNDYYTFDSATHYYSDHHHDLVGPLSFSLGIVDDMTVTFQSQTFVFFSADTIKSLIEFKNTQLIPGSEELIYHFAGDTIEYFSSIKEPNGIGGWYYEQALSTP